MFNTTQLKISCFSTQVLISQRAFSENACSVENIILPLQPPPCLAYRMPHWHSEASHVPSQDHPAAAGQHLHLLRAGRNRPLGGRPRPPTHHLLPWPARPPAAARLAARGRTTTRSQLVAVAHARSRLHAAANAYRSRS